MSIYKAMTGVNTQRPDYKFLELAFSDVAGTNKVTFAYKTMGVTGNIILIVSDQPINIRIDDTYEIINVKRHIITYPTKTLQIKRSDILHNYDGLTNAKAEGLIAGRVRIWGFDAPSLIDTIYNKVLPPTEGLSNFHSWVATQVTDTTLFDVKSTTLTQIQITALSVTRALSVISKIQIVDTYFPHIYASFSLTPAALTGTLNFCSPIICPPEFSVVMTGVANAASTDTTIDITFNCI
jgi:hypothetical protein